MDNSVNREYPAYRAPTGLANPHLQTMVSSALRRTVLDRRLQAFISSGKERALTTAGHRVHAHVHERPESDTPIIAIIPGWLGHGGSSYVLGVGHALWQAGFNVARLTLRDHGETAHLNESMFHSALTDEVVDYVDQIVDGYDQAGLVGVSLGGNFALRVAKCRPTIETLAICPAVAPRETIDRIDRYPVYRRYFVNKWRRIFRVKALHYPERYRYDHELKLGSVAALTDLFVDRYSGYDRLDAYFAEYDLTGDTLDGVNASVLAARDDPIIAIDPLRALPSSIAVDVRERGGHGAFLANWRLDSWLDGYVARFFSDRLQAARA